MQERNAAFASGEYRTTTKTADQWVDINSAISQRTRVTPKSVASGPSVRAGNKFCAQDLDHDPKNGLRRRRTDSSSRLEPPRSNRENWSQVNFRSETSLTSLPLMNFRKSIYASEALFEPIRFGRVERFPYLICFVPRASHISVVAILHGASEPAEIEFSLLAEQCCMLPLP